MTCLKESSTVGCSRAAALKGRGLRWLTSTAIVVLTFGCGGGPGGPTTGGTSAAASSTGGSSTGGSSTGAAAVLQVPFDPTKGQYSEGLTRNPAASGDEVVAGLAFTGQALLVSPGDAGYGVLGSIPAPPANAGADLGMAYDAQGNLYFLAASFNPASYTPAIYRIPVGGGDAAVFASDPKQMPFPNGIRFDGSGSAFVADSAAGAILKVEPDGGISTWASGALLAGNPSFCSPDAGPLFMPYPLPFGANDLVVTASAVYVTNTTQASVVQIPINADGSAGPPAAFAGPNCDALEGADGLWQDTDGSFLVAVNIQNKIVRVSPSGTLSTVVPGSFGQTSGALDFPASLVVGTLNGQKTLYVTNLAFLEANQGKGGGHPGVVAVPLP